MMYSTYVIVRMIDRARCSIKELSKSDEIIKVDAKNDLAEFMRTA
jgi:hypothetical protein